MIDVLDYGYSKLISEFRPIVKEEVGDFAQLADLTDPLTPEQRKEFIRIVRDQDLDVGDALDDMSNDTIDALNAATSRKGIINAKEFVASFLGIHNSFFNQFSDILTDSNQAAAQAAAQFLFDQVFNKYKGKDDWIITIEEFGKLVEKYPEQVAKSLLKRTFPVDDVTLGERIVTIQGQSLEVVKSILAVGIRDGKSADNIAFDIDSYLRGGNAVTGNTPFQWTQEAKGLYKQKKLDSKPRGTVSSNSLRIARTEINMTYRKASMDLNQDQPWFAGIDWHTSGSHKGPDICDEWQKGSPYTVKTVPSGHPYCMCYTTTRLKSIDKP